MWIQILRPLELPNVGFVKQNEPLMTYNVFYQIKILNNSKAQYDLADIAAPASLTKLYNGLWSYY